MELRRLTTLSVFSFALLAGAQAAPAQETFGTVDSRAPVTPKDGFLPYSTVENLKLVGAVPEVVLESVNLELIALEDADDAAAGSKVLRYGIGRDLYADLGYGKWFSLRDGSMLWALDLVSTGALGLRA